MAPKKRAKMESSAIATRSSTRTNKAKLVSDPQRPNSKKPKTNTSGNSGASSSMASKKIANTESSASAIVTRISTRHGKAKINSPSAETQQPKSKKRANAEPSAILTRSAKGKAKLESELPSADTHDSVLSMKLAKLTISENRALLSPAPKKMANVKPSTILTRSAKGKAKMESTSADSDQSPPKSKKRANVESSTTVTTRSSARRAKGKAKMESNLLSAEIQSPSKSKKTKLTISEGNALFSPASKKRANVQTSTILTRSAKDKAKEEEPPKSKKAKTAIFDGSTSSSTILTRRGKAKLGSDSTAADPLPPKSKKAKTTTSGGNSSVTIRANVEPSSTRVTRSSTRNSKSH